MRATAVRRLKLLLVIPMIPLLGLPLAAATSVIQLPIEVMGPANTVREVEIEIPANVRIRRAALYMRFHNLSYNGQASLQWDDSPWIALDETNPAFRLLGLANTYGGLGGGFSALQTTLPIGSLEAGKHVIRFRFNRSDGFVNGFRVLELNVLNSNEPLLPPETFHQDDPATWTAPIPGEAAVRAGRNLWYKADLSVPLTGSIHAKCTDCHTQDGRDLKYFNYSNFAIRSRAQFHGLSETEGDQLASYIRSLNVPSPGRPWNPPYQPGPGLDAKPVSEWAAGAGLGAVLDRDRDMIPIIFPNGIDASGIIRSESDLSARSTPIAMQLPDWNHWLPQVHPKDAYVGFEESKAYSWYLDLRRILAPHTVSAFLSTREIYQFWPIRRGEFFGGQEHTLGPWSEARVRAIYSSQLWGMVKNWELNQEFGLEAMSRDWHGPQADDRAWTNSESFQTSPHMLKLPTGMRGMGVRNEKKETQTYTSFSWYHLQLILNNSNKRQESSFPIDWNYSFAFIKDMANLAPQAGMLTLWTTKGLQVMENGFPPGSGNFGWNFFTANIMQTVHVDTKKAWNDLPPAERNLVLEALLRAWLDKAKTFTPEQYYASGHSSSDVPHTLNAFDGTPASRFWFMLVQMKGYGLRQDYLDEAAVWAQGLWPNFGWAPIVR